MAVSGAAVGVRFLTELLDPSAYGQLALALTVSTLVIQIILGPLGSGITRFYAPAVEKNDVRGYLNAATKLILYASGILALTGLLAIAGLWATGRSEWVAIAIVAIIFAVLSGYNSILNGIQNAARQRSIVALHQGIETWLRFIVAVVLLMWLGRRGMIAIIGYSIATILVLSSQFLFFRKTIGNNIIARDQKAWQEKIWSYSIPIVIWGVFTWMYGASDRWALALFATTREVGLYAVVFQLGYYPISIFCAMTLQFLGPIFYQRSGDASDDRRNADVSTLSWRVTASFLAVTAVAFCFTGLFHAQILHIFVAPGYGGVSGMLPWLVLAGGIFSAGESIALNMMSQLRTHALLAVKTVTAIFGVGLNFMGAYFYGIRGVIIAGVSFSVLYFCGVASLSLTKSVQRSGSLAE